MKIYLLLKCVDWESDVVIGVYANREMAEAKKLEAETNDSDLEDYYDIIEKELEGLQ